MIEAAADMTAALLHVIEVGSMMAIGQPFEPVAPLIGAGVKINTDWYFRSAIKSSKIKFSWLKMPCLVCSSGWHGKARLVSGLGTTSTAQVSPPVRQRSLPMTQARLQARFLAHRN